MAYKKNYLDEEMQGNPGAQGGAGGQVLAGNSGSGPTSQQPSKGSGWTNLSTYLDMNAGQTEGLGNTYNNANQKVVDDAKGLGADLVKTVQNDPKHTEQITAANNLTNQIKTGDLSKVDPNQYKAIQAQGYSKPTDYGQLNGYSDVLSSFGKAADRVDNVQDYGTQQGVLRDEFSKNYNQYNSGMGTLDTFLLRGDKDAAAKTAAFKDANKGYGSTMGADGKKGYSANFNNDVSGVLNNFFTGQESAFNAAKGNVGQAVADRRTGIVNSVTPAMLAKRQAEVAAENKARIDALVKQAGDAGVVADRSAFDKFAGTQGTLDAADLLSDADWNALAALEGLDGIRSEVQNQGRNDYKAIYDADKATQWIAQNTPPPKAETNSERGGYGTEQGNNWSDTTPVNETVDKSVDDTTNPIKDTFVENRDKLVKNSDPLEGARRWKKRLGYG